MQSWYQLDNAAKVFPSVTGDSNSSVFRISATLKQPVDPVALQHAVEKVMVRFPMFSVRLRRGIFWNYLDANRNPLTIQKEQLPPCRPIDPMLSKGYLLRVLYYHHRITVEIFHSLTDGTGALELLKSILLQYFAECGNTVSNTEGIKTIYESPTPSEVEDSFKANYTPVYAETPRSPSSFHIKGVNYGNEDNSVTHGILNSQAVYNKAKQYGGSLTAYLASVLIYSIYQCNQNQKAMKKPVVIAIPVNLRRAFPSKTLRNFFNVINVGAYMDDTMTVEKLVPLVQEMLQQKTSKTYLQSSINSNVNFEKNIASKFVPLFVKKYLMRIGFSHLSERKKTITLTNLGKVSLPEEINQQLYNMELMAYPTQKSPMACGMITCQDQLTITFIKNIIEPDIIQYFFSYLASEEQLAVKVYSNNLQPTFN